MNRLIHNPKVTQAFRPADELDGESIINLEAATCSESFQDLGVHEGGISFLVANRLVIGGVLYSSYFPLLDWAIGRVNRITRRYPNFSSGEGRNAPASSREKVPTPVGLSYLVAASRAEYTSQTC